MEMVLGQRKEGSALYYDQVVFGWLLGSLLVGLQVSYQYSYIYLILLTTFSTFQFQPATQVLLICLLHM